MIENGNPSDLPLFHRCSAENELDARSRADKDAPMDRRQFIRSTGVAAALPLADNLLPPSANAARIQSPALMKVGKQHGNSDAILRVLAGFGVNHICSRWPSDMRYDNKLDHDWSVDGLSQLREHVESFGIALDMVPLPLSMNLKGIGRN